MGLRQAILAAARGQMPERVPWTIYSHLLPRGACERELRTLGLALAHTSVSSGLAYSVEQPNVVTTQRLETARGIAARRTFYRTPVGELTDLRSTAYASGMAGFVSDWRLEFMVKTPADYDVLEFMIRDEVYHPTYDAVRQAQEEIGDDGIVFAKVNQVPWQRLWSRYAGIERLALDCIDHPEPVQRVLNAMLDRDREIWELVAGSPVEMVQCPEGLTSQITGPALFEKYYLPVYEEIVERIDPGSKPLFIHMDGLGPGLAEVVKRLPAGMIVEALTPPPMGTYSVAEARSAWGERPIWINFPSSTFLAGPEEVEAVTLEILRQAVPGDGFLLGITENIPSDRWQQGMRTIGRALERHGACPLHV